jgi:catechol 2,3-dioxygenase-like lactoylglutathione lyase family enzyme
MILRIHHAQITVPVGCEAKARDFYCRALSLPEVEKPESLRGRRGFWLQIADQQIHVGTEDGVDRSRTKSHIAYQVFDLDEWRTILEREGISITESVPIPGCDRLEFRDPFGNRVELIQPTS